VAVMSCSRLLLLHPTFPFPSVIAKIPVHTKSHPATGRSEAPSRRNWTQLFFT